MEWTGILATTDVINRGSYRVRIAKEVLENGISQINGSSAVPFIANHDPLCMPVGKIKAAWLEERADGEWALCGRTYMDDEPIPLTLAQVGENDGPQELVILRFPEDPRPFKSRLRWFDADLAAGVEIANFRDRESFNAFRDDIAEKNQDASVFTLERHEFGPEPFIQFVISNVSVWEALGWTTGGWLLSRLRNPLKYIADELLQEVADGVVDILRPKIRRTFDRYRERAAEDDRDTLVGIQINASPVVRLYARISESDSVPDFELSNVAEELDRYGTFLSKARELFLSGMAKSGASDMLPRMKEKYWALKSVWTTQQNKSAERCVLVKKSESRCKSLFDKEIL